ncbi:MAG: phenylacetate--CoA ligase family protein [Candidatus Binatia bacterium]
MTDDRPFYRPEVQTLPREQIAALQLERLQALITRVWERPIPFFRRKLEAAGLTLRDIRSLDDLRAIPTTVKDDLRASEAEHPPLGDYRGSTLDECVRVGCSTGTSGKPTLIFWTRHDQAIDLEAVCRGRWRWGLRPGSSLAHGHPFGLYGGGISFSKGIEALGLLDIPCAPPSPSPWTREVVKLLSMIRPAHYRFFGNAGAQYADAARAAGYDAERDLNLRVQGEDPKEQYKSVSAGLEALGMLGTACDADDGAHVAEDLAIAEVLDRDSGRPVGDGARGNLVITVLGKDNAFLRYDLQDIVRLNLKPCPCGETHKRLFYEGRVKDVVAVGAREILPIDVLLALLDCAPLKGTAIEYQIIRRPALQALPLRVEHAAAGGAEAAAVTAAIAERTRARLGVPVEVELLAPNALPRFAFKAARVVDEG